MYRQVNIDTLPGPTYFCGGLAYGNAASMRNKGTPVSPRQAALEALEKMKNIRDLGVEQWVLPPHPRPSIWAMNQQKIEHTQLNELYTKDRDHFLSFFSAAYTWTANSAIFTPSCDSQDQRCHITPANCIQNRHRYMEAQWTYKVWKALFHSHRFVVHPPIADNYPDEGSANIIRLHDQDQAIWIAVYGAEAHTIQEHSSEGYIPRQSREAMERIQKHHQIDPKDMCYAVQLPEAIQRGVFHNDVISLGHGSRLILHEHAFKNQEETIEKIQRSYHDRTAQSLQVYQVTDAQCDLETAIQTYIFNSQLFTNTKGEYQLVAPQECQNHPKIQAIITDMKRKGIIHLDHYVECRWSMLNGGGPACCRLKCWLNENELAEAPPPIRLTDTQYDRIQKWIQKWYPTDVDVSQFLSEKWRQKQLDTLKEGYDLLGMSLLLN